MEVLGEDLSPGMKCIKYLMVAFNSIFVFTGILIIVAGTTIHAIYYNFDEFLAASFFSPASLLIAVGIITFFVAIFGCIGAARESTCLINMFALLLTGIFILEISAAIAAFAMQDSVRCTIHDEMLKALTLYEADLEIKATIDTVQNGLECCGVDSIMDWKNITDDWNEGQLDPSHDILLPDSCCASFPNDTCDMPYVDGCLPTLSWLVRQSATLLAVAALTVAMIQVVGIYFAYTLAKAMREAKSLRTRRQYEIQQQLLNSYSLVQPKTPDSSSIFISSPDKVTSA